MPSATIEKNQILSSQENSLLFLQTVTSRIHLEISKMCSHRQGIAMGNCKIKAI